MDIESVAFDMRDVLKDLHRIMDIQAEVKDLELVFDCVNLPSGTVVMGDPGRIRQILTNLLSNSIKFTKHGTVRLSMSISHGRETFRDGLAQHPHPTNDGTAEETLSFHFAVEDDGIGITETALQEIFQPFHQAQSSTARLYGGTGLGLSITKQLVELMGGRIELKSELNVGTVAHVDICLRKALIGPDEYETSPLSMRSSSSGLDTRGIWLRKASDKLTADTSRESLTSLSDVDEKCTSKDPAETSRPHILIVEDKYVQTTVLS